MMKEFEMQVFPEEEEVQTAVSKHIPTEHGSAPPKNLKHSNNSSKHCEYTSTFLTHGKLTVLRRNPNV